MNHQEWLDKNALDRITKIYRMEAGLSTNLFGDTEKRRAYRDSQRIEKESLCVSVTSSARLCVATVSAVTQSVE
jgi:hypothetical protein